MPKNLSKRGSKWKVKTPTDEGHSSCKKSLPTIPSASDLISADVGFPAAEILIKKEERRETRYSSMSSDQSEEESTAYASSSCVSDDDSMCSDSDSLWSSVDERSQTTPTITCNALGNGKQPVVGLNSVAPTMTKDPSATAPSSLKVQKPSSPLLRTSVYGFTILCMVSPFSCGMAVARVVERMPLMPILWNLCLIAKQRGSRVHVPMASVTACLASMVAPLPIGMVVARFVQHQPLITMLCALCAIKGKRHVVQEIYKIVHFAAHSLTVPTFDTI